jgi:hypothetical protein
MFDFNEMASKSSLRKEKKSYSVENPNNHVINAPEKVADLADLINQNLIVTSSDT